MALKGCTSSVLSILRSLLTKFDLKVHLLEYYYTPGIYTEGYIVFVFPFIRLFVCTSVPFVELLQRLFDVCTSYFGSMNQYDPTFDLKIDIGHCDLYFMVQWFCLISWRLFDVRTILFGILSQYDPNFDLKINIYWHKKERPFYKVLYLLHQ